MLKYEEFKEILIKRIKEFLPEECQNVVCEYGRSYDTNSVAEEFFVKSNTDEIMTSLNVENMYRKYLNIKDINKTLQIIAGMIVTLHDKTIEMTRENIYENVVYQLINAKQNEKLLKKLPHRRYLDLAIIYKVVNLDEKGMNWRWIANENMESLELSEQQLSEWANTNTVKLFPATIKPLSEYMREQIAEMMNDTSIKMEDIKDMINMVPDELPPARDDKWFIQTKQGINSSVYILYGSVLDQVASKVEDDIYLVPISTDELMAVSVRTGILSELEDGLLKMNTMINDVEDRLSNNVYLYDRERKKIRIVSNNRESRLDTSVFFIKL